MLNFSNATAATPSSIRAQYALSEDQLYRVAPSIFATEKHESRSERFQPIATIKILRGLEREGFVPVYAGQSRTRDAGRREFTKHLIRLRHIGDLGKDLARVDGHHGEIVLKNGNDGSAAYSLMTGIFRIVCTNGLITASERYDDVKVRHSGDVLNKVIEGTYTVLENTKAMLAAPADWSQIKLSQDAKMLLANEAHHIRFANSEGETATPIRPEQMLRPRRSEDDANDLWTTFNVLQENAIKGGLQARNAATFDEYGRRQRGRMTTTREVKGIDQDVKVNQSLWRIAEFFAQQASSQHRNAA